jgi:hypothetical protein
VGERTSFHVNSNLKYNNLVDMLFYNFNILYRKSASNYLTKSYYTSDRTYLTTEKKDDTSTQLVALMNLTQSFIPIRLAVTLTPQYTQMRSSLIQQDLLFRNRAQLASLTLKLDSKYFQHLTLAYQASGRQMWNDNNIHHRRQHKEFQHKMDFWYFPIKRFNLSLSGEHSLLERENGNYDTYLFANFKARYLLKKVEFEFTVNNLSNNRHYALTNLSGINSTFRTFPLRERAFLLSAKVSF